jgi:hypothetical protein
MRNGRPGVEPDPLVGLPGCRSREYYERCMEGTNVLDRDVAAELGHRRPLTPYCGSSSKPYLDVV